MVEFKSTACGKYGEIHVHRDGRVQNGVYCLRVVTEL